MTLHTGKVDHDEALRVNKALAVIVRVDDGLGNAQVSIVLGNVLSGLTGYHKAPLMVS